LPALVKATLGSKEMTEYLISGDLLDRLIDIGARESFHELTEKLSPEEIRHHKQMMIQTWQFWYPIAKRLTEDNLKALIKSLTVAESFLVGWQGGSVSAVIWLFNKYSPSAPENKDNLTDWILRHTDNYYVPFSNYGAKSLKEYYELRAAYMNKKHEIQIEEEERHQTGVRRRAMTATENIFGSIRRGDTKAVQGLIQTGADLTARNTEGLTPLQWAEKYGKTEIINILRQPQQ
jgi:hypothetical protein